MLMNTSLKASDLSRQRVADFYDAMYKTAMTRKTVTEMESPMDKFNRDLELIKAQKAPTEEDLRRLELMAKELGLRETELRGKGDYFTNGTDTLFVPQGVTPPPGYNWKTSTDARSNLEEKKEYLRFQNQAAVASTDHINSVAQAYDNRHPTDSIIISEGAPSRSEFPNNEAGTKQYLIELNAFNEAAERRTLYIMDQVAQDIANAYNLSPTDVAYNRETKSFHNVRTGERLKPFILE